MGYGKWEIQKRVKAGDEELVEFQICTTEQM